MLAELVFAGTYDEGVEMLVEVRVDQGACQSICRQGQPGKNFRLEPGRAITIPHPFHGVCIKFEVFDRIFLRAPGQLKVP